MLQVGEIFSLHPLSPPRLVENILSLSGLLYLMAVSVGCASPSAQLPCHGAWTSWWPAQQSDYEPAVGSIFQLFHSPAVTPFLPLKMNYLSHRVIIRTKREYTECVQWFSSLILQSGRLKPWGKKQVHPRLQSALAPEPELEHFSVCLEISLWLKSVQPLCHALFKKY